MRRLYAEPREFFIKEFNKLISDRFIIEIPEAGLNFLAWLRCEANFARVVRVCTEIGIKLSPLRFIASNPSSSRHLFSVLLPWTRAQIRESLPWPASGLR